MKFISQLCITAVLGVGIITNCYPSEDERPKQYTAKQLDLLDFAYKTALEDGHKNPEYIQGIIMQESRAGEHKEYRVSGSSKSIGARVFGVAQVKLVAALEVMKRWPEMWGFLDTRTNEELQARLILDDKFNIRIASKYALMMGMNERPNKAIASYNLGPGGVQSVDPKTFKYTVNVKDHAAKVEKYTQQSK